MSWFTRGKGKQKGTEAQRLAATLDLAQSIINPHLNAAAKKPTFEEKRDAVTGLTMALSYAVCLIAHRFMQSDPKEFSEHMAKFIEETMNTLNKAKKDGKDGRTNKETSGDGQSIN